MTQTAVAYFFYSLGLLFREGMEAMLVVVALAAGTRGAGRIGRARDVYAGAVAAIFASILLAWAVNHLITDDASDTLEGVFQLFAAATLFYVSSWMTSKGQADRWMKFISHKLESAESSTIPGIALGLTAFLAVMREGAETIVFFQALTSGATETVERHAVAAGIVAAAVALAASFVVIKRAADRIPMKIFFHATSIMLYALGDRVRRPGRRQFAGSVRRPRDLRQLRADDSDARYLPDDSNARRAGCAADARTRLRVGAARRGCAPGQGCGAGGDAAGAAGLDCSSGAFATESAPPNRTVSTSELSFSDTTSARNPIRMQSST